MTDVRYGVPVAAAVMAGVLTAQVQLRQNARDTLPHELPRSDYSVLADVDGDGAVDLVFVDADPFTPALVVARNDGSGGFPDFVIALTLTGYPSSITAGDVDSDGDVDLVIGRAPILFRGGQTQLLVGDGAGHFALSTAMPADEPLGAGGVVLFDADGDRDLDLFVCGTMGVFQQSPERLYVNDGRGTFTLATTPLPQDAVATVEPLAADVDLDGDLDLVMLHAQPFETALYRNDGPGGFVDVSAANLPTHAGLGAVSQALVDADGDGDPDLVVAIPGGRDRLFENDGAGRFTDVSAARLPGVPGSVAFAPLDVDGDGDRDLLVGRVAPQDPTQRIAAADGCYENDGAGRFTDVTSLRMPSLPTATRSLHVADPDGDGDPDVLIGERARFAYLRDEGGRFVDAVRHRVPADLLGAATLALADVDRDGDVDLLGTRAADATLVTALNDGDGWFAAVHFRPAPSLAFTVFDADGDGDADVVFAVDGQNVLMFGDGTGRFVDVTAGRLPVATATTAAFLPFDADGDGDLDLLQTDDNPDLTTAHALLVNDGTGRFTVAPAGALPARIDGYPDVAADLDGDGDLDVAVASLNVALGILPPSLLLNQGGTFTLAPPSALPTIGQTVRRFAAGDVDGDGDVDLFAGAAGDSWPGAGQNHVLLNQGGGTFVDAPWYYVPQRDSDTRGVALVDIDDDGRLDVLEACDARHYPFSLQLGSGRGGFSLAAARIEGAELLGGQVLVADIDGDGDPDFVTSGPRVVVNHHQQLDVPFEPLVGGALILDVYADPHYGATVNRILLWYAARRLASPIVVMPFGTFQLDPATLVEEPTHYASTTGLVRVTLAIPSSPALVGLRLSAQAGVFHSQVLTSARFSNAVSETIGR